MKFIHHAALFFGPRLGYKRSWDLCPTESDPGLFPKDSKHAQKWGAYPTSGDVLPYISHKGMCPENGYRFCPFRSGIGDGLRGDYDCAKNRKLLTICIVLPYLPKHQRMLECKRAKNRLMPWLAKNLFMKSVRLVFCGQMSKVSRKYQCYSYIIFLLLTFRVLILNF